MIQPVKELFLLKRPATRAHNFSLHGSPSSFGRGYDADWIRTVVRQHGAWANADCAGVAVFLASSASAFVTGAATPLDGGYSYEVMQEF